jgi:hypothetical protein
MKAKGLLEEQLLICILGTGPDVNGVSSAVPDGCVVDQAAYVVRHGSRYPDQGAYNEWVALYTKVSGQVGLRIGSEEGLLSILLLISDLCRFKLPNSRLRVHCPSSLLGSRS